MYGIVSVATVEVVVLLLFCLVYVLRLTKSVINLFFLKTLCKYLVFVS